jgi:esterase/lipase superfamily enzyme
MHRDYGKWHSARLGREMEYLWFGWSGRPLIMFPTSGGRYSENEDFHLVGTLADKIDAGMVQVVCLDSIDRESWYNKHIHPADRARRHEQYDDYLRWEMIPYIQHRAQRGDIMVYGASFGAYHAANAAGRHYDVISKAILFSGVYDVKRATDGYWDDRCYFHSPASYIANMDWDQAQRLARVEWIIATGEHDTLVNENRGFSWLLGVKGIPNYLEIWPGVFGHDWPWWRENLRRFV